MNQREIKFTCPCGEELKYNKNSESTDPWECPDKECWIIPDNKGGILVGKPIKNH